MYVVPIAFCSEISFEPSKYITNNMIIVTRISQNPGRQKGW